MTNINNKRSDRIAADQAMINGVQKFLAQFATLPVEGKNMTPTDIVTVFQGRIGTATNAQTADAARTTAVKADRDERANTAATTASVRRIVLGMFNANPDTLAVFGLKALKAAKPTVATKSAAVAKNKATRVARGTVGPKKKLAIKGTVPADNGGAPAPATPAPATTAATPAAPVAPLPAETPAATPKPSA
jgi:hypothetical protein